jgi:hypothetical protein
MFISQAQAGRLWAIAYKELGLREQEVRAVFLEFGVTSTKLIAVNDYEKVIGRLREYADANF